jgi:hypothetical protein
MPVERNIRDILETGQSTLLEADMSKRLDMLVRAGLMPASQLVVLKRGLEKFNQGKVPAPNERAAVNTMINGMMFIVLGDDAVFNRAKTSVQKNRGKQMQEYTEESCSCCDSKIESDGTCGCDSSCSHCGGQHAVSESVEELPEDEVPPVQKETFDVIYASAKNAPMQKSSFDTVEEANEFLQSIEETGHKGIISQGGEIIENALLEYGVAKNTLDVATHFKNSGKSLKPRSLQSTDYPKGTSMSATDAQKRGLSVSKDRNDAKADAKAKRDKSRQDEFNKTREVGGKRVGVKESEIKETHMEIDWTGNNPFAAHKKRMMESSTKGDAEENRLAAQRKAAAVSKKVAKSEKETDPGLDEGYSSPKKNDYTDKEVKQAKGIAFDKRYKGGNMTGASNAMNKIKKGLSDHPVAADALRKANESTTVDSVDSIEQLAELSYKEKFDAMLKKEGTTLGQMSDAQKKEFFAKVDKNHVAVNEGRAEDDARDDYEKDDKRGLAPTKSEPKVSSASNAKEIEHIVPQMRKALSVGKKVQFKDGKHHDVPKHHAAKFLAKYMSSKPNDKEHMQTHGHKSIKHFATHIK